MIRELCAPSPPTKDGRAAASVEFNEVHLLRTIGGFAPNLSGVDGALRPVQEMVNLAAEDIAHDEGNPMSFRPYIRPIYIDHTWLPRRPAHLGARGAENRGARNHSFAFQMRLNCRIRVAFSAEMRNDWIGISRPRSEIKPYSGPVIDRNAYGR